MLHKVCFYRLQMKVNCVCLIEYQWYRTGVFTALWLKNPQDIVSNEYTGLQVMLQLTSTAGKQTGLRSLHNHTAQYFCLEKNIYLQKLL